MTDTPQHPDLSPAGRARRDAMLPDLLAELDRTHQSRAARQAVLRTALVTTVGVAFVTAVVWINLRGAPRSLPRPIPVPPIAQVPPADSRMQYITTHAVNRVQIITTRPAHALPNVEILDDTRLLQALADAGRRTGLITIDGHTRTARDVTEPTAGG